MPTSNKTEHLGLNQWLGTDKPKRADFVEDNAAIDQAVYSHTSNSSIHLSETDRTNFSSPVVAGSYVGDGLEEQDITLPFQPAAVLVIRADCGPVEWYSGGYAMANFGFATQSAGTSGVSLSGNVMTVCQSQMSPIEGDNLANLNMDYGQYFYIALRGS